MKKLPCTRISDLSGKMSWADFAINQLRLGNSITMNPRGHSMTGRINDGDFVTIRPLKNNEKIEENSIVLVRVKGLAYLHLIKQVVINPKEEAYLIGNNKGGINGWVTRDDIYGILEEEGVSHQNSKV